jgi:predicted Fe-S protein YdhL (DUF1289 family)
MENTPVKPDANSLDQFLDQDVDEPDDADDLDTTRSPCINVCQMNNDTGLCEGCARTLDEIAAWSGAGDDQKRAIWRNIQQRRAGRQ